MVISYKGHRFPPEIISHAIWLYHRFTLSFRDVEDLLAERGVTVSYESIRSWCTKFGPNYAGKLRKKQARLGEIRFLTVHGPIQNLFRVGRQLLKSEHHRLLRERAFSCWKEVTCVC